jgi:hypothetical protein
MEAKELADIIAVIIGQKKTASSLDSSVLLYGYFPQVSTISSSASVAGVQ